MKQLRHCGVPLGRGEYGRLLQSLSSFRGAALESQKNPLQIFASVRVDVTAEYLLQEMRNDRVELDSRLVCGLVGLYAYPVQWHCSRAEVADSCKSIEVGGVTASRNAVQQAMQLLDETCRAGGLEVDEAMLVALIRVCCAGKHDDLAMDIISSISSSSRQDSNQDADADANDRMLEYRVPLSEVLFAPILSMHCQRVDGLEKAEALLQYMVKSGLRPTGDMLGEMLHLLVRADDLGAAVLQISRLHTLTGQLPPRASVLALLDSLLEAKNDGDRRRMGARDGRDAGVGKDDDVGRLLQVVGALYSGSDEEQIEDECIYYEDLEELFTRHNENIDAYDI
jgi:hypothetical protein